MFPGILTMYLAIVYVAARIIRSIVTTEPIDVIITEMPNPDYLLKICNDVYLVREARDFILEEDLFSKIIFLFRSVYHRVKAIKPKLMLTIKFCLKNSVKLAVAIKNSK